MQRDENHPRQSLQLSIFGSLRNFVDEKIPEEDEGRNIDNDDDSFVFTDQIHQRQEIDFFSQTLHDLGFIPNSVETETTVDFSPQEKPETETTALLDRTIGNSQAVKRSLDKRKGVPFTPPGDSKDGKKVSTRRRDSKIQAYHQGQNESFLMVLEEIDQIQDKTRKEKGFKEWKFALGLINCLFIAYVFGSRPEDFGLLYAVETMFWMTYKFRGMWRAKPLSEALYYLDFCWVMNALCVCIILATIILDDYFAKYVELRKNLFIACFGIFCGPVFLASMTLPFVAFLFHDVNTMANLIIHLMPSMVMYNQRWHAKSITAAYPTMYPHLEAFMEKINSGQNIPSVSRLTVLVYFAWFIPYTIWMLTIGLKLPAVLKDKPPPKYDTVFHSTWKGTLCEMVGTAVWKRSKKVSADCSERNDYELRDFLLYMTGHAVGSCVFGIIILGDLLCYRGGKSIHAMMIWFAIILCAKRGADRYTYYVTAMYGKKLRKAFKEIELRQRQQLK